MTKKFDDFIEKCHENLRGKKLYKVAYIGKNCEFPDKDFSFKPIIFIADKQTRLV